MEDVLMLIDQGIGILENGNAASPISQFTGFDQRNNRILKEITSMLLQEQHEKSILLLENKRLQKLFDFENGNLNYPTNNEDIRSNHKLMIKLASNINTLLDKNIKQPLLQPEACILNDISILNTISKSTQSSTALKGKSHEIAAKLKEYQEYCNELLLKESGMQNEIQTLNQSIVNSKELNVNLQSRLNKKTKEIAELNKEILSEKNALIDENELLRENRELKVLLKQAKEHVSNVIHNNRIVDTTMEENPFEGNPFEAEEVQQMNDQLREQIGHLTSSNVSQAEIIQHLKDEIRHLQETNSSKAESLKEKEEYLVLIQKLEQEIYELKQRPESAIMENLNQSLEQEKVREIYSASVIEKLNQENSSLKAQLESAPSDDEKIRELHTALNEELSENENLKTAYNKLETEYNEWRVHYTNLYDQYTTLQADFQVVEEKYKQAYIDSLQQEQGQQEQEYEADVEAEAV